MALARIRGFPAPGGRVDLVLEPGMVVRLSGRNGSGKTSLLRSLAGLSSPLEPADATLDGRPPAGFPAPELARCVGFVHQEARDGLVGLTVAGEHRFRGQTPPAAAGRQDVATLSSGQARRLAIGLAEGRLLLLDEPAEGLDEAGLQLLRRRVEAARQRGCVVVVDHEGLVADVATHHIELAAGDPGRPWELGPPGKATVLDVLPRTVRRGGHEIVLPGISVPAGLHAVVGPNGSGKSTLLRALAGLHGSMPASAREAAPSADDAVGTPVPTWDAAQPRWLSSRASDHLTRTSVREELEDTDPGGLVPPHLLERHPLRLSGGEQKRVALAKVLGRPARVYLLDEPEAHLDAAGRDALQALLALRVRQGSAILAATHDPQVIRAAHSVIEMPRRTSVQAPLPVVWTPPVPSPRSRPHQAPSPRSRPHQAPSPRNRPHQAPSPRPHPVPPAGSAEGADDALKSSQARPWASSAEAAPGDAVGADRDARARAEDAPGDAVGADRDARARAAAGSSTTSRQRSVGRDRAAAWGAVAVMALATAVALLAPWPVVAAVAAGSWCCMRRRWGFLAFAAVTVAFNAALLSWLHPAAPDAVVGPVGFSRIGFAAGAVAGARIVALLAANLAIVSRYPTPRLLEDLGLPRRALAFLAAVFIAAHDVGRDFARLRDAQRLETRRGRIERARAAAGLVPALVVAAVQGAQKRQEALRLAGLDTGRRFAPIVAVTALAVAGRLALVAVPNVSLTFAIVFAGGVAFGARVGFWAGLWSMLLTDLMLSGLFLPAFVNVPTTALLGALGGAFSRVAPRAGAVTLAASAGILATLAWSVATDGLSWALIPENRQSVDRLRFAVVAGLVFNAVPALVNGFLFAAVVGPVQAAFAPLRSDAAVTDGPADGRPTA